MKKSLLRMAGLVVIVLGLRSEMASAVVFCTGTCTVTCDSGATYYYTTRNYQCCGKLSVCPNGGSAEWWPGFGPECWDVPAEIC